MKLHELTWYTSAHFIEVVNESRDGFIRLDEVKESFYNKIKDTKVQGFKAGYDYKANESVIFVKLEGKTGNEMA